MAIELLSLSKFKLQLVALISEARDLREGERRAREEFQLAIQRQKQSEADYERKLQELQAEIASRDEIQHKLETKELHFELHNLELTVQKIQDSVIKMGAEDQKAMSSLFEGPEVCEMTIREENENSENIIEVIGGDSLNKNTVEINSLNAAMPFHQEHTSGSCLPKPSIYPPGSECSDPSSMANPTRISMDYNVGKCASLVPRDDSESSTTGTDAREAAPP